MIQFPGKAWLSQFDSLHFIHHKIIAYQIRRSIKHSDEHSRVAFRCNLCGHEVTVPPALVVGRETRSCYHCGSTQRMHWLVLLLSKELFNKALAIPEFPGSHLTGIGISDAYPLAIRLMKKFNYINTYYHRAPRLDITDPNVADQGPVDFIITSDVLEHVAPPIDLAFDHL